MQDFLLSLQEQVRPIVASLFAVDSIGSVILRFVIWGVIALTIIISMDVANPEKHMKSFKANLGLTLLFLVLGGVAIWLLFGFTPQS
jgi:hypothetical protein